MWKKWCGAALLLTLTLAEGWATSPAPMRSEVIVYIDGAKYYVHTVQPGETLYGLARLYATTEEELLARNPEVRSGLQAGQTLKAPVIEANAPQAKPATVAPVAPSRKFKKTFLSHEVVAGETLYAIARRYEISVDQIIEDNPGIDPTRLALGSTLMIRKKAVGKSDDERASSEWERYRDELNRDRTDGYTYYIVQPGETLYALSQRFGTTVDALCALNDFMPNELRAGGMIKLPGELLEASEEPIIMPVDSLQTIDSLARPLPTEVWFSALKPSEPLHVALLLPMSVQGRPVPNYLDFYRGFLLGLDRIRTQYSYSVRVDLYDTERNPERVRVLVEAEEFASTQLIVGPVYEEELEAALVFGAKHSVPVVTPLADLKTTESDVLFQMAPAAEDKYAKLADLLTSESRVTLISAEHTDRIFEQEVLTALQGVDYGRFQYRFGVEATEEGIVRLLTNECDNLFVILSDNEVEVERILAAIASANTNLVARGRTAPRFMVLGNARWNRFQNLDRTIYFKDRVVLLSTYHAKRDAEVVLQFDSDYIKAFGVLPSLYAYRGYDAAMIFVPGMYSDIQYDMQGRRYTPLQTTYTFEQESPTSTHLNRNWMRVNYHPDFTITLE